MESGKLYGRFTEKQTEMIDRFFDNFNKNQSKKQTADTDPPCKHCLDVGVLEVKHNGQWTLAICEFDACKQGSKQGWNLRMSGLIDGEFRPVDWREFKPAMELKEGVEFFKDQAVKEKIRWWRRRIEAAEIYWRDMPIYVVQPPEEQLDGLFD